MVLYNLMVLFHLGSTKMVIENRHQRLLTLEHIRLSRVTNYH